MGRLPEGGLFDVFVSPWLAASRGGADADAVGLLGVVMRVPGRQARPGRPGQGWAALGRRPGTGDTNARAVAVPSAPRPGHRRRLRRGRARPIPSDAPGP